MTAALRLETVSTSRSAGWTCRTQILLIRKTRRLLSMSVVEKVLGSLPDSGSSRPLIVGMTFVVECLVKVVIGATHTLSLTNGDDTKALMTDWMLLTCELFPGSLDMVPGE